ncbi:MAG: DNA cytosine methyltransferase, partial [Prevotella sp.]|nr:DNA cytosine methyltransferase [Prevotella sp.]
MANKQKIGLFSFFSGAGFLDLGFENTQGFKVLFVNEFHKPFMDIYKYARENMGIRPPIFGYNTDDICEFLKENNNDDISLFIDKVDLSSMLNKAKTDCDLVGFIGGPPCPDFSVGGSNKGEKG